MAETSTSLIIGFILTTFIALWFLFKASRNKKIILGIIIWMLIVSVLGLSKFYGNTDAFPPRFFFLLGPGLLFVLIIFLNRHVRKVISSFNLKWLTLLHIIRIPVEYFLYFIYLEGLIPELMTFNGYNFDILSGITAPIIYYLVFVKKWVGNKGLLFWNIICLGLLINILTIAFLSAQTPLQKLAFYQPNIGVTYFPFVWLPAVIVPIVLLSHLSSIRQLLILLKRKQTNDNQNSC
ncbi:hypothetical protein [Flavivirga rizhaonensis]|uniref:Uncharacterized protein n=1 Tax=Flavivirga rizhaonensis TaxID=2559571 RepID=A0A4S1DTB5_9FLAO|nr:hypothetical protein [Flavivirga rizhaonensis]TGV00612.1 hypothetical protein EM932_18940 [Flavivirga rizhaonensis]